MQRIYVIHENEAWLTPLRDSFHTRELPFDEWFIGDFPVALDQRPPDGVFYNRMSASAHTRGNRFAPEFTGAVLSWLEGHGRRVVNGTRALQLEVSKAAQYASLNAFGIKTPRTVAATGAKNIIEASRVFGDGPVLLKPNRGGTGHGVQLFESAESLRDLVGSGSYADPIDGITLLQQYISSPEQYITRAEFIGGRFFYAVRVDTGGSFELCPADPCVIGPDGPGEAQVPQFTIVDRIQDHLVSRYEAFLAANGIEIGAIEFVTSSSGETFTYDVNTNTNYNSAAESRADRYGMDAVAWFLGRELTALRAPAA